MQDTPVYAELSGGYTKVRVRSPGSCSSIHARGRCPIRDRKECKFARIVCDLKLLPSNYPADIFTPLSDRLVFAPVYPVHFGSGLVTSVFPRHHSDDTPLDPSLRLWLRWGRYVLSYSVLRRHEVCIHDSDATPPLWDLHDSTRKMGRLYTPGSTNRCEYADVVVRMGPNLWVLPWSGVIMEAAIETDKGILSLSSPEATLISLSCV